MERARTLYRDKHPLANESFDVLIGPVHNEDSEMLPLYKCALSNANRPETDLSRQPPPATAYYQGDQTKHDDEGRGIKPFVRIALPET